MKLTPEYISICIKKILTISLIDFSTKDSFLNQRLIFSSDSNETNPNSFLFHVRYDHQQDSDQIFERFTLHYSLIPKNPSIQRFLLPEPPPPSSISNQFVSIVSPLWRHLSIILFLLLSPLPPHYESNHFKNGKKSKKSKN